ncbi:DUF4062 domain-containing protein [Pantoea ananatis]|uniref:DUF4062 domain-containing protein n=1 Tax=Pantoea ananas TaxID=553 RepID=UPI001B31249E|nr:DUF4062 domain-containing protein [Pantoea ananatis]
MDKRYQVFVSSTFKDLEQERSAVIQTLMEMDCIPAGMELFPAIDEEQWEFIKKIIDDCDYYLLIIAGRYGSLAPDGISYTEMEFDYAIQQGKKAIVLVHEDLSSLPAIKSEADPALREKLNSFIEKATTGRLRKTWSNASDLAGKVSLSMQKTIRTYPEIGWVRANKISNEQGLSELIKAKNEIEKLKNEILELKNTPASIYSGKIASFDSKFELHYNVSSIDNNYGDDTRCSTFITWGELYHFLSPYIYKNLSTSDMFNKLNLKIDKENEVPADYYTSLDESDLMTIELQFTALGLIDTQHPRWQLTPKGIDKMLEVRIVKD